MRGARGASTNALLLKAAFFLGSLLLFGGLPPPAFTSAIVMLACILFLWILSLRFGSAIIDKVHRRPKRQQ